MQIKLAGVRVFAAVKRGLLHHAPHLFVLPVSIHDRRAVGTEAMNPTTHRRVLVGLVYVVRLVFGMSSSSPVSKFSNLVGGIQIMNHPLDQG